MSCRSWSNSGINISPVISRSVNEKHEIVNNGVYTPSCGATETVRSLVYVLQCQGPRYPTTVFVLSICADISNRQSSVITCDRPPSAVSRYHTNRKSTSITSWGRGDIRTVNARRRAATASTVNNEDSCDVLIFTIIYSPLPLLIITDPPTHSVGGQFSNGRWCLLSSVVVCNTRMCNVTHQRAAHDGGPVVFRPV